MIQHKKYLACQAWCTPIANMLLLKFSNHLGISDDFHAFIPGLAVTVSHFFLLAISFINVPSYEDVRVSVSMKRSRRILLNCLKNPDLSPSQEQEIKDALSVLRSKEIAKCLSDVDHAMDIHKKSMDEEPQ